MIKVVLIGPHMFSRYWFTVFFLLVPALAGLGHDLFVNYYVEELAYGFRWSDYGYLLQLYYPLEHDQLLHYTPPEFQAWIIWILSQKSVLVGLVYAAIMPVVLLAQLYILKLLFGGPTHARASDRDSMFGTAPQMKFKYKRR